MTEVGMRHVVMFSGGIASWAVARRVVAEHGTDAVTLLFADTLDEDEDLYRFLADAAENVGAPVTRVADGRNPREVMSDRGWVGNTRIAQCSHLLKQEMCRAWLRENSGPDDATVYVGIDWTEAHRLPGIERGWSPWSVRAPLTEPPYTSKARLIGECRAAGIREPRLYAMGFPHNNCGGACVRGGQAQWAHLLRVFPERFAKWETWEVGMRERLGDVAILRDRTGGATRPLPLTVLRQRVESESAAQCSLDLDDWGGCGCFTETEEQ